MTFCNQANLKSCYVAKFLTIIFVGYSLAGGIHQYYTPPTQYTLMRPNRGSNGNEPNTTVSQPMPSRFFLKAVLHYGHAEKYFDTGNVGGLGWLSAH
jgi:hypothetical protein